MKTLAISMWYNEAALAHYFLKHYSYMTKIIILLDSDTNDSTEEIINQYLNTQIIKFTFPEHKVDEDIKAKMIRDTYKQFRSTEHWDCSSSYDWIFNVDADELIMPKNYENIFTFLGRANSNKSNLIYADILQVYRNIKESDLVWKDIQDEKIVYQRRYGTRNFFLDNHFNDTLYIKPIVVKPNLPIIWSPGNHNIICGKEYLKEFPEKMIGGHWAMADLDIAIERRIKGRKERQSKNNIEKSYNVHQYNINSESLKAECELHLYDERVF